MSGAPAQGARPQGLKGWQLALAGLSLALANFVVVLDITIANVSVPHIAGSLAVSPSQGTWVITSYSVAEAICVPLSGWLAARFGAVRVFLTAILGFALFSLLCGLSRSLEALILFRIFHADVANPDDADLSAREGRHGARPVEHDGGGCANPRPDLRRHDFRRLELALDLLHQSAGRGVLHVFRPALRAAVRDPYGATPDRLHRPCLAGDLGRRAADRAR
jgi:hypothetical protein